MGRNGKEHRHNFRRKILFVVWNGNIWQELNSYHTSMIQYVIVGCCGCVKRNQMRNIWNEKPGERTPKIINEWMKKYSPYLYICVSTLLYCQKMLNSLSQICLSLLNFLWPLNVILQYYFRDRYQSNLFYNDGCNLTGHSKRHLLVRTIELRC